MHIGAVVRIAATAIAAGAMLVTGIAPARAAVNYPPHVSMLYASPVLGGGYAAVSVSGEYLATGLSVRATRGSHTAVAGVTADGTGTIGSAVVKVAPLLPSTAGRYAVDFALVGASVTGSVTTSQTYTVGKAIAIKSFSLTRKSWGISIGGTAAKSTPVKISIALGSKTYKRTVVAGGSGRFSYAFHKTTKGTYTVTAQVAANKKYFSDPATASYTRG